MARCRSPSGGIEIGAETVLDSFELGGFFWNLVVSCEEGNHT